MELLYIFGPLVVIASVIGWKIYKDQREASWPAVEGFIEQAEMVPGRAGAELVKVVYSYTVNGKQFVASQWWSGPGGLSLLYGPKGKAALIHYNPSNPEQSAIDATSVST